MADQTVEHARTAVYDAKPLYVRSISFCRIVLASGHLSRGELEPGLTLAEQVLNTASALRSGRTVAYIRDFITRLAPHQRQAPAAAFIERAKTTLPADPARRLP